MWLIIILCISAYVHVIECGDPKRYSYKSFDDIDENFDPSFTPRIFDESLSFRLPNNTVPTHYDLLLLTDIHLPNFEFFGTVTVHIRAVETSQYIVMNYKQLIITNINLFDSNGSLIESGVNYTQAEVTELLTILPQNELIADQEYRVTISYRGTLRTDHYGFYRASYINEQGNRIWYATSQFQATDARHSMPCYDEPHLRTSFSIRIRHHQSYIALSNMPVQSRIPGPIANFVITTFEKIPSMQTYLLVFTISDFDYAEDTTVVPPQRVYAKPESIRNHEYELALKVSPEIMLTCENFFNMSYTFPKMDQIAVTEFPAGAMENWGSVLYLERFLLFDPLVSTTRDHENILTIISHEFVHQWIGNKVVFQWWTYLWLNEAFATLYEYYMVHLTYPEERYDDSFLVDVLQRVLEIDANPNIRPMSLYVEDPWSILMLFDWIAYSKGGSVLYTFMNALGQSTWQKGLQYYLTARYDNYANPGHLYENLQIAVNQDYPTNTPDVAVMLESWEWQSGFPIVTVNFQNDHLILTQERFFYNTSLTSENLWYIPINYISATNPNSEDSTFDFWMSSEEVILRNESARKSWLEDDWLIFNIKQNYYYRVNYDLMMWNRIIKQLNEEDDGYNVIHLRNRAQLIDDSYHLARGNRIDYSILFSVMDYLRYETDYIPWVPANRAINILNRYLSGSIVYTKYQEYMRSNTAKLFNKLGVNFISNEPRVDRFARSIAMNQACRAQLPECLEQVNEKLIRHLRNNERIETEYFTSTYCNGMRQADGFLFIAMQNKLIQSSIQSERNDIISGMGCVQNQDLVFIFLNLAITPGIQLTSTEKLRILTSPTTNGPSSLSSTIEFVNVYFSLIQQISSNAISNVLTNIANNIASEEVFDKYDELLRTLTINQIISGPDYIQYLANGRINLNWQASYLGPIAEFFEQWKL